MEGTSLSSVMASLGQNRGTGISRPGSPQLYQSIQNARTPQGYQNYTDQFYQMLNAPRTMPQVPFVPIQPATAAKPPPVVYGPPGVVSNDGGG
jgi:hypothetical protein